MRAQADHGNGALRIGELPVLRIVELAGVHLHEDPDPERVARLVDRFGADGVLRNPPVAARDPRHQRWIVLDGANRVTALRRLGCPHVLLQEVDLTDPGLALEAWHHAVEHHGRKELLAHARGLGGVTVADDDGRALGQPGTLCRLTFADGTSVLLLGADALATRVEELRRFTGIYHRFTDFDRVSYTDLEHLGRNYPNFATLVSFGRYGPEDLLALVDAGLTVPSGLTRVLLPKRALRFNLRLELLRAGLSLQDKEAWLGEAIRERVLGKAIRFYREPTFLFDE